MQWRALFKRYGDFIVTSHSYEIQSDFTVEQLYQAFKLRLQAETEPERQASGCYIRHEGDRYTCGAQDLRVP